MFIDRRDGGIKLAAYLKQYTAQPNTIVLGLPRGGVVTAYEVAKELQLPLDVICPRKIGAPSNPEYAIGAITETGEGIFNEEEIERLDITQNYLKSAIAAEKTEAQNRMKLFRSGRPAPAFKGKTVIVVDDGMATGLTMKAAIISLRASQVSRIVVAIPVAPKETLESIQTLADEVVCILTPAEFYAVGQFYREFGQTSTQEVVELLKL